MFVPFAPLCVGKFYVGIGLVEIAKRYRKSGNQSNFILRNHPDSKRFRVDRLTPKRSRGIIGSFGTIWEQFRDVRHTVLFAVLPR